MSETSCQLMLAVLTFQLLRNARRAQGGGGHSAGVPSDTGSSVACRNVGTRPIKSSADPHWMPDLARAVGESCSSWRRVQLFEYYNQLMDRTAGTVEANAAEHTALKADPLVIQQLDEVSPVPSNPRRERAVLFRGVWPVRGREMRSRGVQPVSGDSYMEAGSL